MTYTPIALADVPVPDQFEKPVTDAATRLHRVERDCDAAERDLAAAEARRGAYRNGFIDGHAAASTAPSARNEIDQLPVISTKYALDDLPYETVVREVEGRRFVWERLQARWATTATRDGAYSPTLPVIVLFVPSTEKSSDD